MGNIDKTTGQITCVGRLHSGIGKTLTGTVGRDEVLQHRHTLLEVRQNRVLNDLVTLGTCLLRFSHQTANTRELLNLILRTTGTRVEHHEHSVKSLVCLSHLLKQDITNIIVNVRPSINNLIITLVVGDKAHIIVVSNLTNLVITLLDQIGFFFRDDDIIEIE